MGDAATVSQHEARCVWTAHAVLGESPLWLAEEGALYWVDILRGELLRYFPMSGHAEICRLPVPISALAPMADGRLLCAGRDTIYAFDTSNGRFARLSRLRFATDHVRINDGCVHADGAFWFGTMDIAECASVGDFHRYAADGSCVPYPAGYAITNGPGFSPDGKIGYFVDSVQRRILSIALDDGRPAASPSLFAEIGEADGYPDGIAVDADGGLWCALWGGARVVRFDAKGRISTVVRVPASNVSKCAFGGERLDQLFITTARKGLDATALASQPQAGGLFEVEIEHPGLAPRPYCGTTAGEGVGPVCVFEAAYHILRTRHVQTSGRASCRR